MLDVKSIKKICDIANENQECGFLEDGDVKDCSECIIGKKIIVEIEKLIGENTK